MRGFCEVNGSYKFQVKQGFQLNGKDGTWTLVEIKTNRVAVLYQIDGSFDLHFNSEVWEGVKVTFVW